MENDYTYHVFDAQNRPSPDELLGLVSRAWGHDYSDKAIIWFDDHYLDWLLQGNRWFGIEVRTGDGQLAGCEVALERQVSWHGRSLKCHYVTLLSVDPAHRGRGLGQGILRLLAEEAHDRRGTDLIVSTFDAGAAGKPTVEKAVAWAGGRLDLRLSPAIPVWACVGDFREIDRYEPMHGLSRVALWPGIRSLLGFTPKDDKGLVVRPASLNDVTAKDGSGFGFGFDLTAGPATMYGARPDGKSGTLQFDFGPGQRVTVSWHIATMRKPGLPDRSLGTVQFVQPEQVSASQLARALRYVNSMLLRQGCLATTILQNGIASGMTLWRAGFRPTPRKVHFAVRGRAEIVSQFGDFQAPFGVDLL